MASSGELTGSSTLSTMAKYDSINLKGVVDPNKSDLITIDGDVKIYVTGDLILGNGDELQVLPDSSLIIYLGGNLFVDNSGGINNLTKDPKKLKIYELSHRFQ